MKKFNFKIICSLLGLTSVLNGSFMLLSLPVSIYHGEKEKWGILSAGFITIILGFLLWYFNRKAKKNIPKREGYFIVTSGWLMLTLTGTLPYILTGAIPNLTDAFFETLSGYSTTGSSILKNVESFPKSLLFWRSATHWIGGMGIIVLAVAILPILGIGGMQLFVAEAPGPTPDKLHPRITQTANRLWLIYLSLTLIETLLLRLAGMNWFDSVNHAMSTMSTGGFSTKNTSVAYWNNKPIIQYIISLFMFISGTNFILTYFALRGKIKKVFESEEFKYYLFSILGITLIITILIIFFQSSDFKTTVYHPEVLGKTESAFRHALFQVISITTTTGFITADFTMWNSLATMIIFCLFFVGGSAGSTSGGVKIVRHIVMIKNSVLEFKKLLHPNAIIPVRYDKKPLQQTIVFNILSFFVLYMLIFFVGSVLLTFMNMDFESALGATATSMGNIGPAIGSVGPVNNFSHLTSAAKWLCALLMLLGRLELFTILILLTPFFWNKD